MTVISSSQSMYQDSSASRSRPRSLDLMMATVGLGKDHEKENLFLDQGEWHPDLELEG